MRVLTLLLVLLLSGTAAAREKSGVTMPDQITVAGKSLQLNGMGLREATALKVDVYVAGLYLEHPSSNPAQIMNTPQVKVLTMKFVRDVDRDDILKAWHEGFRHNATVPLPSIQRQMDQLDSWMSDFKKGDVLTFTARPGKGVQVDINNVTKGVLDGDAFGQSLFSIWLGPQPPSGALKRDLLGQH